MGAYFGVSLQQPSEEMRVCFHAMYVLPLLVTVPDDGYRHLDC